MGMVGANNQMGRDSVTQDLVNYSELADGTLCTGVTWAILVIQREVQEKTNNV